MSILRTDIESAGNISLNTLLAGLSVTEALNSYAADSGSDLRCLIKWPNDIVTGGRKICGILTELISEGERNSMITGIGINTGQAAFPSELSDKGTSYFIETGVMPEREEIIKRILRMKTAGNRDTLDRYEKLMVNLGREVVLTSANGDFRDNPYIARGVTDQGDLIVEDRYGNRSTVTSGEVSVRGVLGYV